MSVYNEPESQIRESLDSLFRQSFQDFELIIVNDNPKRGDVWDILDSYNDTRIVFYQNPQNVGLAMSMNKAAELAHTDVYARMDADDIAEPERLNTDLKYLQKGYDVVFSGYTYIDENSKIITNKEAPNFSNDKIERNVMLDPSIIHHPTTMFTRMIFEKVGGYRNFPCSQDADLWMRMAETGAKFYYIQDKLLRYRINPQSVSSKRWFKQQLTCNYIFDLSMERLQKGRDSYSIEGYNDYLVKWGISEPEKEKELRQCYKTLSDSSAMAAEGYKVKSLLKKAKVFLRSALLRKHYLSLQKKKRLLG